MRAKSVCKKRCGLVVCFGSKVFDPPHATYPCWGLQREDGMRESPEVASATGQEQGGNHPLIPPPPPSPSPPLPSHPILAVSPYQDLEKATVLQECRVFHDANIVTQDPRRCCQLITKLLHILTQVCGTHQGEGKDEGREIWREGRKY